MTWQLIDTAPQVAGVEILIFSKDGIDIVVWQWGEWMARGTRGEEYRDIDTPTHWMPLPPNPT